MQSFQRSRSRIIGVIVALVLAFGVGGVVGAFAMLTLRADDSPTDFGVFWQAWNTINENFIDREVLASKDLTYGAINGLVQALGDEGHTAFLTPEELETQQRSIAGSFSGIGAQLGVEDGLPIIVAPFDGSPAAQSGVKAGDIILSVNGEDITGLSISAIAEKIRGPEGTEVTLTLFRPASEESLEITIVRGEINIPAVDWTMIPDTEIGLLRLTRFSANAQEEVVAALNAMQENGAQGVIVDLRNNPGGLLTQAVAVTSQFLTEGTVLQQENAQGERLQFPVEEGGVAPDIPLVVLTNPGTASSSEIFAGAIQDHERGIVIGETTFGTGTVLQTYELSDGSALLLGTSQWLTASGRLIRKQGIAPDIVVALGPEGEMLSPNIVEEMTASEIAASGDPQLLAALAELGVEWANAE
ncbi:MAG TPA: S41 family peptidase [Caldilineaceae bacterium]|nr:S41 family peptidase [Caldilineaceae bacterium]